MLLSGSCLSGGKLVLNYGATNVSPTQKDQPLLLSNTQTVLERTDIWSWVPTGPEAKNDCAGEGQQQSTAMLCYAMD
jgi:hypothetical protein